ncbi:DUF1643 domain-containing protein [Nonomuraea sp. NPDC023979]|uniref:DUF1643 domain-containing protein n=1 Tax=Nonomuraea sp. NPDC023979 TaxID=3154796 RepID=UPI0033E42FFA
MTHPKVGAVMSGCRRYRYQLVRRWSDAPLAAWVLLNPSTADALTDDPTVRRCAGFARAWGWGGIELVNLYAWRTADPGQLREVADPVGPINDEFLASAAARAAEAGAPLVAGWGVRAESWRVEQVLALPGMDRLCALALSKDGRPRHPLYLLKGLRPQPYGPDRSRG